MSTSRHFPDEDLVELSIIQWPADSAHGAKLIGRLRDRDLVQMALERLRDFDELQQELEEGGREFEERERKIDKELGSTPARIPTEVCE